MITIHRYLLLSGTIFGNERKLIADLSPAPSVPAAHSLVVWSTRHGSLLLTLSAPLEINI